MYVREPAKDNVFAWISNVFPFPFSFPALARFRCKSRYRTEPLFTIHENLSDSLSHFQIPPHGRWRHLDAGVKRVQPIIDEWKASSQPPDDKEVCRRLIDLFLVSVLLDAGAGNVWKYTEPGTGLVFSRSEGLGVASMHMFRDGLFSSQASVQPYRVDGNCSIH